jgi:3'-phosphoadenosine 5'-phosphosulfate sulfotransferase (PAPS reductase)/FAD synthetase
MIPVTNSFLSCGGLIDYAISKGAKLVASISGGKDGQAMVRKLMQNVNVSQSLIHCDLGRSEWHESLPQCQTQADEYQLSLQVLKRSDGKGLMEHMSDRMQTLAGSGKPFWPSSSARYCTSDLKREPSDKYFRNMGEDFIISCEGIRAQESKDREKKQPLSIRTRPSSSYYEGMTVEQAITAFEPGKRLVLTWYPIFNFSLDEVWATYGMNRDGLLEAREIYKRTNDVAPWWPFHPAYAYGNDRVSCVLCILGSMNDLKNGARHRPELLAEMIDMEKSGEATFKNKFSLKQLLP